MRPVSGKDHANDRSVVGDVEAGVCKGFVLWNVAGAGQVCEPRDFVEETDDEAVDRSGGAAGDVVGPVIRLLFTEDDKLVCFVGDDVVDEVDACDVDKVVGNVYGVSSH